MTKRKSGRPKKADNETRARRIAFRVTEDELMQIEAAALRAQVGVGEYARHAALTARAPQPPKSQTSMAAVSELNRVGVNLYQLVKHLNFGTGHIPADLDSLLADIRNAVEKIAGDD